ncbi:MAG: L-threonylcarbamoyladenylate synthase [Lysobacterales bacterium]
MHPELIAKAAQALARGELVAMPTETVYGLAADARNADAVRRIFAAKGRPQNHPVIVHLPDRTAVTQWAAFVPPAAERLMDAFWPGPLTLVLKKAEGVDPVITGGQDTVGLRLPAHPVAQALLRAFGGAVAAPSANRFGRISPTAAEHVREEFPDGGMLVLDGGASEVGLESTIVDLSGDQPRLLRPGHIAASAIEALIGPLQRPGDDEGPRASGRLESHYAPGKPVLLLPRSPAGERLPADAESADQWLVLADLPVGSSGLVLGSDPEHYARQLYGALRQLDAAPGGRILIEMPPDTEAWAAVRDRLQRAAAGSR